MSGFTDELRERGLYAAAHAICLGFGLRVDELRTGGRAPAIVEARARFARYLIEDLRWSYPMVGRLLGKDHTTILSMLGASSARRDTAGRRAERFARVVPIRNCG